MSFLYTIIVYSKHLVDTASISCLSDGIQQKPLKKLTVKHYIQGQLFLLLRWTSAQFAAVNRLSKPKSRPRLLHRIRINLLTYNTSSVVMQSNVDTFTSVSGIFEGWHKTSFSYSLFKRLSCCIYNWYLMSDGCCTHKQTNGIAHRRLHGKLLALTEHAAVRHPWNEQCVQRINANIHENAGEEHDVSNVQSSNLTMEDVHLVSKLAQSLDKLGVTGSSRILRRPNTTK